MCLSSAKRGLRRKPDPCVLENKTKNNLQRWNNCLVSESYSTFGKILFQWEWCICSLIAIYILAIVSVHSSTKSSSIKEKPERTEEVLLHLDRSVLSFTVTARIRNWLTQTPAIGKDVLHQWAIDYFWTAALGDHCSAPAPTAKVFRRSWHTENNALFTLSLKIGLHRWHYHTNCGWFLLTAEQFYGCTCFIEELHTLELLQLME